MITKTVFKDYFFKRCPYLASLELQDKTLVQLLKDSIDNQEKYQELVLEAQENGDTSESLLDYVEIFREYPNIKKEIQDYSKTKPKNKAEQLIEKYNDDQIVSKLSRRYYELKYGKENCFRCDVNADGEEIVNQKLLSEITERALKDESIKVIFEGQIEFNNFRARFDVLIRNDDGTFDLVEVKGSNNVFKIKGKDVNIQTGIKEKYLYDLLFQYYVYSCKGLRFKNIGYLFSRSDYKLKVHSYPLADSELNSFFKLQNEIHLETGDMSLIEYFDGEYYIPTKKNTNPDEWKLESLINDIKDIEKMDKIKPEMRYLCVKGPRCPFVTFCFGKEADEAGSTLKLTRWPSFGGNASVTNEMLQAGIKKLSGFPDNIEKIQEFRSEGRRNNAYTQIQYGKGRIKEKYVIDKNLVKRYLLTDYYNDEIDYLLFFDFESFQYPIPLVEHSAGWKQIVSQYSMHVVKKGYDLGKHDFAKGEGGGVKHYEYIANPDITGYANPSIELYKTLRAQLIESGIDPFATNYRVVVFNETFEQSRMNEFVREFVSLVEPDLINFVAHFHDQVVDLLDFFTSGSIYSRDFNGRGSLKVVQPTLAADENVVEYYKKILPFDLAYSLDYHKEDKCLVYNGGICLDLYKSLLVRAHLGGQKEGEPSTEELLAEALAYCKIDSWGTVIIYDVIKNMYLGKLKLDALYK